MKFGMTKKLWHGLRKINLMNMRRQKLINISNVTTKNCADFKFK